MKRLFLILLFIPSLVFAQEVIVGDDYKQDSVIINDELRKLDIDEQIKSDDKLDLQNRKIENLATPTATTDAATKAYVDSNKTTDASLLTSGILPSARLKSYDSGWVACPALSNTFTVTHNLGTTKILTQAFISNSSDGSGVVIELGKVYIAASGGPTHLIAQTTNTLVYSVPPNLYGMYWSGGNLTITSGAYYRVMVLALE